MLSVFVSQLKSGSPLPDRFARSAAGVGVSLQRRKRQGKATAPQGSPRGGREIPVSIFFVKYFLRVPPFPSCLAAGLLYVQRGLFFMPSLTISELQGFLGRAFLKPKN